MRSLTKACIAALLMIAVGGCSMLDSPLPVITVPVRGLPLDPGIALQVQTLVQQKAGVAAALEFSDPVVGNATPFGNRKERSAAVCGIARGGGMSFVYLVWVRPDGGLTLASIEHEGVALQGLIGTCISYRATVNLNEPLRPVEEPVEEAAEAPVEETESQ